MDENNSTVIDLVSAGYTVEQSIDAVDKYGTLEAALSYLEMSAEEENEGQSETTCIPLPCKRQLSGEEDDFNIDWYVIKATWWQVPQRLT